MKWAYLLAALGAVIPCSIWLKANPKKVPLVWIVVGFLVLQIEPLHLYMSVIFLGGWPGYTHGAEVSLLDLIALSIYLSLPKSSFATRFKLPMAFYLFTVLISVLQASFPNPTIFYAWQLLRTFFFCAVVTKACSDPRVAPALIKGMALSLLFATANAIVQRLGHGVLRANGGYEQENYFGIVSHFIIFPLFALLLAGERNWLAPATALAGVLIAILTVSRATFAFDVFGYVALFILSLARGWTSRKFLIISLSAVASILILPWFISSYGDRFAGGIQSAFMGTDETRIRLVHVASMMLSDHPLGIGANQFPVVAYSGYYQRAGVSWVNFGAIVHNVYWLVAAETGYLGLVAFVVLLFCPMAVALRCGWRNRRDERGDLLLGLGIGLLTVYLHSTFEWILVTFQAQYIWAATSGLIAGLATQLGYWPQFHPAKTHHSASAMTSRIGISPSFGRQNRSVHR